MTEHSHSQSGSFTFRPATLQDAPAVTEIYNHYVAHSTCTWDTSPASVDLYVDMIQTATDPFPFLIAESTDTPTPAIVGWCALRQFKDRDGYRHTATNLLYVSPNHLGQGLGRLMLQTLITHAKQVGHRSIIAQISADQTPSITLHESLGFTHVALIKEAGTKFDKWIDLIDMQLML